MFTTIDKAIAGLITPILSLLALYGFLPENLNTPEFIGAVTALITSLAVYLVPNKVKG